MSNYEGTAVKRVLCLDIGSRRVGVAVSDPLGFTAQPLETIMWVSPAHVQQQIAGLRAQFDPATVVVGLPLSPDGTRGASVRRMRRLLALIKPSLEGCALVEWDERFSSVAAERALLEADMSRKDRKKVIDCVAASLILQSYLGAKESSLH